MTIFNLIYLGQITDRIPIVPMFTPSWHIGGGAAGGLLFSEVFDIPRFIEETGQAVLEWHQVKDRQSEVVDEIGCWNVWETVQYYEAIPRGSDVPQWLHLGQCSSSSVSLCLSHCILQIFRTRRHQTGLK